MIELQEHNGKLKVENYGLMEWALDLQTGINQGFELDDSNEGYCQNFGSLYTCLMIKSKTDPLTEEIQYLRKELKQLQESTINGVALKATQEVLPDKQAETYVVFPVDEVKDVLVIAPWVQPEQQVVVTEETIVAKQETPPVQSSKRGPKPKNS